MIELLPLYIFVFFGLFSPGPNVILLTASGARFGLKATLPHIFGVALGVGITSAVTGLGLGVLLQTWPSLRWGLQIVSAAWILYLAWKLWTSSAQAQSSADRPFTMVQAILFQWVNPKVWAVSFAAMAYVPFTDPILAGASLSHAFSGINLFVCLFWVIMGNLLAFLLKTPIAFRWFLRCMALCLAMTVPFIFV